MKWGESTWIFLHTLSVKIHPHHYNIVKNDLFRMIKLLGASLPCPDCASHAVKYMAHVRVPPNKDSLILFLIIFHNSVNARQRKPQFNPADVIKYNTVNITAAFHACRQIMLRQPYNPRIVMYKIKTEDCFNRLHLWLGQNRLIQY